MTGKAGGRSAVQKQRRALILGYLTDRSDARVRNQVRVLAENGYAVDVICLAEDNREKIDPPNLIGIRVPRYRGSKAFCYVGSFLPSARPVACPSGCSYTS